MKKINLFEANGFNDLGLKKLLVHESPYFKILNFNFRAGQQLPIHSHDLEGVKQHRIMTHHRRPILTPSGRVCKHPARGLRDDRLSLTGRMSFASVSSSRFLSR